MCQVYSVFDRNAEEVVGMTGADFSYSRSIPHEIRYLIPLRGKLWVLQEVIFDLPGPFSIRSQYGRGCGHDWS